MLKNTAVMSNPLDLTITGKPTPRTTERVHSARKVQRPLSANRSKNTQSNIFGSPSSFASRQVSKAKPERRVNSAPIAREHDQAREKTEPLVQGAVLSRHELEATRAIIDQNDGEHNRKNLPEGIPKLQLGNLVDKDDKLNHPIDDYRPAVNTPSSAESVSWGTPVGANRPPSGKKVKGGGWQVNQSRQLAAPVSAKSKRHDDVPSLDLCLSNSNEGLKELAKVAKQVHEDIQIEYIGAASQIVNKITNAEEEKFPQQTIETQRGNTETTSNPTVDDAVASLELEKLEANKKKHLMEEKLLVDEMSRTGISQQTTTDQSPKKYDPKQQRHKDLFSTQSPITGSSDSSLLKRLRFGARIISRNGHDANREINGFFFPSDSSITMYEFRQFGKRSNALPFIQRNCYSHIRGFKKGRPYTILDISVGNDLHFETANQVSLPDSLKLKPIIAFKVIELDNEAKEKLIYERCRNSRERAERATWVENYESAEEKQQKEILTALRGTLQAKIKNRAVKTITNMGKHFRTIDKSGDGVLDKTELKKGLKEFRLDVPEQDFSYLWEQIDTDGDGKLDYGEFIRGFLGEMNEFRKNLVRKAFTRLDTAKSGMVRKDDLKKFFSAKKHPKVLTGELKEIDVVNDFLSAFDYTEKKGEISYAEFQDYYEGVSIQTNTDNDFAAMMRINWGV